MSHRNMDQMQDEGLSSPPTIGGAGRSRKKSASGSSDSVSGGRGGGGGGGVGDSSSSSSSNGGGRSGSSRVKFEVGDSALSVTGDDLEEDDDREEDNNDDDGEELITTSTASNSQVAADAADGLSEIPPMDDEDRQYYEALHTADRIGNYVLGRTLGEGAFAKVKIATHTVSGLQVAIKIINKSKIQESYVRKVGALKSFALCVFCFAFCALFFRFGVCVCVCVYGAVVLFAYLFAVCLFV